jgi:hypothetical protein
MIALLFNGLPALSVRLSLPATGAWFADVSVDLPESGSVPSGRCVLTLGTDVLTGTVDPRMTGKKGFIVSVRVVAGGGGWDKSVPAVHLHNDAGVTSTAVYSVTAAAVGEVVTDTAPARVGVDYVRGAGPASRVLSGASWYVDASGVTVVGPRAPAVLAATADVLDWEPVTRRATVAYDSVVWPGTIISSPLFGDVIARDVEQSFVPDGVRATIWCEVSTAAGGDPVGGRLARALAAIARESVGAAYLRRHKYRVVLQGVDGRVTLQSIARGGAVPDLLQSVEVWPGVAGVTQTMGLGSTVLVAFVAGDPSLPVVAGFEAAGGAPTLTTIEADKVNIGAGTTAAVLSSTTLATWIATVTSYINGIAPGTLIAPAGHVSTKLFSE